MAFKIGRTANIKVIVKANVPDGDDFREEKMTVGFTIFSNSEQRRLRQGLIDAGSKDIDLDFLKQHGMSSVEGPAFEDGQALTIDEVLDVPYLRAPIENKYIEAMAGVKRKN